MFGEPVRNLRKSRVGYMPQESALMLNFNLREIIWFFGTIYRLSATKIAERLEFLSELLELPDEKKLIRDCSGGQQRRISFALSLVHEPELLVLDEPTVGVDPLLRCKIWDYLVESTQLGKVTVLMSTHYIEEARQSNCVGVMRNGRLIAEESPGNILEKCGKASLEEAFLTLSNQQDNNQLTPVARANKADQTADSETLIRSIVSPAKDGSGWKTVLALLRKNFIQIIRNIRWVNPSCDDVGLSN